MDAIKRELERLLDANPASVGTLYVEVLELLDRLARDRQPPLEQISAPEIRVVATDECTGQTALCLLPIAYAQTANGVTLSGETYAADPVQIACLSEFALEKLRDLQGIGADKPRCNHHESSKSDK